MRDGLPCYWSGEDILSLDDVYSKTIISYLRFQNLLTVESKCLRWLVNRRVDNFRHLDDSIYL